MRPFGAEGEIGGRNDEYGNECEALRMAVECLASQDNLAPETAKMVGTVGPT
jgi:hypothetical protein